MGHELSAFLADSNHSVIKTGAASDTVLALVTAKAEALLMSSLIYRDL